jgi:ribosomal protein L44E
MACRGHMTVCSKVTDIREDRVDRLQAAADNAAQRAVNRSQSGREDCATGTWKLSLNLPRRNERRQQQGHGGQHGMTPDTSAPTDSSILRFADPMDDPISHFKFLPHLC